MEKKIIYYEDELNDEFSEAIIKPKKIDETYVYVYRSIFKKFTRFFWYRMIATPIAYCYLKIKYRHKIVDKKKIKSVSKNGYFLYGNHTNAIADALIPSMISIPKDAYVIVHPNNVSMPYLGRITPSLGAIPLPDTLGASKNFIHAIQTRVLEKKVIVVYPEGHIWPFHTKIRPFTKKPFKFQAQFFKPMIIFTNTYQKRKFTKTPRIVTYIDGPFYPKEEFTVQQNMSYLRDIAFDVMCKRSLKNNVEIVKYIKKGD